MQGSRGSRSGLRRAARAEAASRGTTVEQSRTQNARRPWRLGGDQGGEVQAPRLGGPDTRPAKRYRGGGAHGGSSSRASQADGVGVATGQSSPGARYRHGAAVSSDQGRSHAVVWQRRCSGHSEAMLRGNTAAVVVHCGSGTGSEDNGGAAAVASGETEGKQGRATLRDQLALTRERGENHRPRTGVPPRQQK